MTQSLLSEGGLLDSTSSKIEELIALRIDKRHQGVPNMSSFAFHHYRTLNSPQNSHAICIKPVILSLQTEILKILDGKLDNRHHL
jgi:hypothetical protein